MLALAALSSLCGAAAADGCCTGELVPCGGVLELCGAAASPSPCDGADEYGRRKNYIYIQLFQFTSINLQYFHVSNFQIFQDFPILHYLNEMCTDIKKQNSYWWLVVVGSSYRWGMRTGVVGCWLCRAG
jgi:hypothetical protein